MAQEWDSYIHGLNVAGVRLCNEEDVVVWGGNEATGKITASTAYNCIIKRRCIFPNH